MRQSTYTKDQLTTLKARGAQYLSIQKHDLAGVAAGTVLGWHKTHESACRKAGSSDFTSVEDINDAISDAI